MNLIQVILLSMTNCQQYDEGNDNVDNDNDMLPYVVGSDGHKTGFPTTSTQFYRRWTCQCAGRRISWEARTVNIDEKKCE